MEEEGEGKEERGKGGGTEGEKVDKDRGKRGEGRENTYSTVCTQHPHMHLAMSKHPLCSYQVYLADQTNHIIHHNVIPSTQSNTLI